ncbi:MAG: glycoside hydrolase family 57 protein [Deferribacteraceae bacterium]|jgi:alpha-amylase|nr:glycoside hydrolase family 57 protein [Deferribacteraceae bacterium]
MPDICFYFQIHQPYRLRHYTFFDIGESPFYENDDTNKEIMLKVAQKCYLPMNKLLLRLIKKYKGRFKVSFSISGTALDQFEAYAPNVLKSFQELAETGCVEFLAETYNHSLAFLYSKEEFTRQVQKHHGRMKTLFGQEPKVFRNTELVYNNDVANAAAQMGYKAILAEGADKVLDWRSPNHIYTTPSNNIKVLLKNYKLSDDIAFRFSNTSWVEYPLTADKYAAWLRSLDGSADIINLFMDYETFGEHQWSSSGIFEFMEALPEKVLENKAFNFTTVSEAIEKRDAKGALDVQEFMSWADAERDLTAWTGNDLQQDAMEVVAGLEQDLFKCNDFEMFKTWGRLQTSDHLYYMCTKWFSDGDVHKYFNPYGNPYDAYINFMNVLADLRLRVDQFIADMPDEPVKKPAKAKAATAKATTTKAAKTTKAKADTDSTKTTTAKAATTKAKTTKAAAKPATKETAKKSTTKDSKKKKD